MTHTLFAQQNDDTWFPQWIAPSLQAAKVYADQHFPRTACRVCDAENKVVAYRTDTGTWQIPRPAA